MKYSEIKKDLFKTDTSYALAHCISQDCKMGAGIAVLFDKKNRGMRNELLSKNPVIGQAIPYKGKEHIIFNLITKEKYWNKPTYMSFEKTIISLRDEMLALNIDKVAMPLLGAGLDRLSWGKNREIIKNTFKDTGIEVLVCKL